MYVCVPAMQYFAKQPHCMFMLIKIKQVFGIFFLLLYFLYFNFGFLHMQKYAKICKLASHINTLAWKLNNHIDMHKHAQANINTSMCFKTCKHTYRLGNTLKRTQKQIYIFSTTHIKPDRRKQFFLVAFFKRLCHFDISIVRLCKKGRGLKMTF